MTYADIALAGTYTRTSVVLRVSTQAEYNEKHARITDGHFQVGCISKLRLSSKRDTSLY